MAMQQQCSSPCSLPGVAWLCPAAVGSLEVLGGCWGCHTRLPGQDTTVRVTLFLCSFSIGISSALLIPIAGTPFTATISSPHLPRDSSSQDWLTVNPETNHQLQRTTSLQQRGQGEEESSAWGAAARGRSCAGTTRTAQASPAGTD